jgi:hypothetical protein
MEVISERSWAWMLFHEAGRYFLSVLCGTVGLYGVEIELNEQEIDGFKTSGDDFVSALASKITYDSTQYCDRHIPDFADRPEVKAATHAWRSTH